MKKVKSGKIKLNKIKHVENSRIRNVDEVSDLMNDIKQRGLLQPVGIRISDNALIYGNRRVRAFEKLNYTEIPCEFYDDVSDNDLLVMNLVENMKRRQINGIEIGRIVNILLKNGLKKTEIASKLDINIKRVNTSLIAYNVTKNTPFEKLVVFKQGKNRGIPETLIWRIHSMLSRGVKKLTKNDWDILLSSLEEGKLTAEHITMLYKILKANPNLSINKAIDVLSKCKVMHLWVYFDKEKLNKAMRREKIDNEKEFIMNIIRNYDKDLIF